MDWRQRLRDHLAKHSRPLVSGMPHTDGRVITMKALSVDEIVKADMEAFMAELAMYYQERDK